MDKNKLSEDIIAVINPNDKSGDNFLGNIFGNTPTMQDYRDKGIILYTQIVGKYSIVSPTSTGCCKKIITITNCSRNKVSH